MESYDAVVVGGGPSGAAAACALARCGRRALLIHNPSLAVAKIGETLTPAACLLLRDLGIGQPLLADGHLPSFGTLAVWGGPWVRCHDSIFDPNGHGWHLDRTRFDARLRDTASAAGAEVWGGDVRSFVRGASGWSVGLVHDGAPEEVHCRWLVDATGRRAMVARRLGGVRRADDRLVGYHAVFRPGGDFAGSDRESRTLVEAVADGWWYTALLPTGSRVVTHFTDGDIAVRCRPRTGEMFLRLVEGTTCLRWLLAQGGYVLTSSPRVTGACSSRLVEATGAGWLAVGDAALAFDPLTSQGLLAALHTGRAGGLALVAAISGDPDAVRQYGRAVCFLYETYRNQLRTYYTLERRWPERPFWKRRAVVEDFRSQS